MICTKCITAIRATNSLHSLIPVDQVVQRKTIHDSLSGFLKSASAGCYICRRVWVSMSEQETFNPSVDLSDKWKAMGSALEMDMIQGTSHKTLVIVGGSLALLWLSLDALPSDFALPADVDFGAQPLSTANTVDLWRYWLQSCVESHVECQETETKLSPMTPDRLVEVICDKEGNPCDWRVVIEECKAVPYLTLSHCWGSSLHTSLTKRNYERFKSNSPCSILPKTYRDALAVVASVGMRYIWIDSLCIIQDDEDDWKKQSSVMGAIYRNSTCNIAALWADDSSAGCFTRRDTCMTQPTRLKSDSDEYHLSSENLYHEEVVQAALNTRAWVLQERYLSRRQLGFAKSQIYWECQTVVASEQFPTGIPTNMMPETPPKAALNCNSGLDLRHSFSQLVRAYSTCRLSHISDKMIAFAGIVKEFQIAMDDTYLAGLWRKDLAQQLCWYTDTKPERCATPTWLAPTWSWMNMNSPIKPDRRYPLDKRPPEHVEVVEATVRSEDVTRLHSFTSSELVLRGVGLWGQMGPHIRPDFDLGTFQLAQPLERSEDDSINYLEVLYYWDENQASSNMDHDRWVKLQENRNGNLLFMLIHFDDDGYLATGLILRPLNTVRKGTTFVRMGVCKCMKPAFAECLKERLKETNFLHKAINLDDEEIADIVQTVTVV